MNISFKFSQQAMPLSFQKIHGQIVESGKVISRHVMYAFWKFQLFVSK